MSEKIFITDVGPRDGLQNQRKVLSVEERTALIESLYTAGLSQVEVGSFVSPKLVPAMANTDAVVANINAVPNRSATTLILNQRGYEMARAAGSRSVTMVLYGSEGMARKNANMGMDDAEAITLEIMQQAASDGIEVIATIAVAFECPFDGATAPLAVERIANRFVGAGAARAVLADTIGAANPRQVAQLTGRLMQQLPIEKLGCHFHDTRALGLANIYAALDSGVRYFDASIAGLGGCPFAPGASGNVATEDAVMLAEQLGFDTDISLQKLIAASDLAEQLTGSAPGGRAKIWLRRQLEKAAP
ncbi:MAG: hydroxymethylglutaryl-CoA lyase [Porticoccaceae bacterium]